MRVTYRWDEELGYVRHGGMEGPLHQDVAHTIDVEAPPWWLDAPGRNPGPRPRLLDLFCCQGGAGEGYRRAGFDIVGVDLHHQRHNPHTFVQADALQYLHEHGDEFDAIHASPPCQKFSKAQRLQGNWHPDLITPTRYLLEELGLPYVIENVEGAPLIDPVELCGAMFGIRTYRHRLFETNWPLAQPAHPVHTAPLAKMGRRVKPGEFMHVVGNFSDVDLARSDEVMGMPWATRDGMREAVPPVYTEHIGQQLLAHINQEAMAA